MAFYHWFPHSPNGNQLSDLYNIGKEIVVGKTAGADTSKERNFRRISSVPDIWSQHSLFEMLLFDTAADPDYSEYRDVAVREWRAMLAVLVLANSYNVEIKSNRINFATPTGNPYLNAAYACRPCANTWNAMDLYYLEENGEVYPIAMSAPRAHVVPTANAWKAIRKVCPGVFPWITEDDVESPVLVAPDGYLAPFLIADTAGIYSPAMSPMEALILKEWISTYLQSNPVGQSQDLVSTVMSDYGNDLAKAYGLNATNYPPITINASETLKIQGEFTPQKYKLFEDTAYCFSIRQDCTTDALSRDDNMFGGIDPNYSIYAHRKDGDFNVAYDLYFIPMPVTEVFWQAWSAMAGNRDYTISRVTTSKLNVAFLQITLQLGNLQIVHKYEANQIRNGAHSDLCVAGLWPRQRIDNWFAYHLFCCECGDGYSLSVEAAPGDLRIYDAAPGRKDRISYYRVSERPTHCLMRKNGKAIGYLPIRDDQSVPLGAGTCDISLDFGTSSTTLFCSTANGVKTIMDGSNLWSLALLNQTDIGGNEASYFSKYFMPTSQKDGSLPFIPFQSLLADMEAAANTRAPLLDSWIWFRKYSTSHDVSIGPGSMFHSNLKWTADGNQTTARIEALLGQLAYMIALEARCLGTNSINVIASYPLSFSSALKSRYFATLGAQFQTACVQAGLVDANGSPQYTITEISESQAAYQYAAKVDAVPPVHCVIDIGGGSTDIFACLTKMTGAASQQPIHWSLSGSIAFGARHILLKKLRANNCADLRLLMSNAADINKVVAGMDAFVSKIRDDSDIEDLFGFQIPHNKNVPGSALASRTVGDSFVRYCAGVDGSNPLIKLKKRIAFYLAAIVYSTGLMIRDEKDTFMNVAILLGGNGSKMVHWLDFDETNINAFVRTVFAAATGVDVNEFTCAFSKAPKLEVASGALEDGGSVGNISRVDFCDQETLPENNGRTVKVIVEDEEQFREFLKVFVDTATACFGWTFDEKTNDYSIDLLKVPRVIIEIGNASVYHQSYFLRAVDGISEYYLLKDSQVQGGTA